MILPLAVCSRATLTADLDEVLKAHEVIMASLQHLLDEVEEELPTAYAALGDRDRALCG